MATEINGHILATDLCKKLASASSEMDSDDYLAHFARNFFYSSPIFQNYIPSGIQVFPAVAIIKFLISEYLVRAKDFVSVDEISECLIANGVTGLEDLGFYSKLKKNQLAGGGDVRQMRELVKFLSQFSFLKWENPRLYLEVKNKEELFAIEHSLSPVQNIRKELAGEAILQMGGGLTDSGLGTLTLVNLESLEEEFTEGKKIRVTHLRTERSSKLKYLYFQHTQTPARCRMCAMDTAQRYPWSPHVIELHHLLPLASPVRVEGDTTSIKDLVGLCPSCHRATHRYYSGWFKANGIKDFRSYTEAVGVYQEAKQLIVL